MLGFSLYLNHDLTMKDYDYVLTMHNSGFTAIFTSLQLTQNSPREVLARLYKLSNWCQKLNIAIIADVSQKSFKQLGISITDLNQIKSLQLTGLRIDDNVDPAIISELSKIMLIALNASTINKENVLILHKYGANFNHLKAWHNYYPRPETGLDIEWFRKKNCWLHDMGLETVAFIAGDSVKRGPIYAGLPTLEKQRNMQPLASMLELKEAGSNHVFVGDEALTKSTINSFTNYICQNAITLHVMNNLPELFRYKWHNRPDVARDVIRLTEGRQRQLFDVEPQEQAQARPIGTITCDNNRYLRYQGELQITKCDLPPDDKVNVIGKICLDDILLLKYIDAGRKIIFCPMEK